MKIGRPIRLVSRLYFAIDTYDSWSFRFWPVKVDFQKFSGIELRIGKWSMILYWK